MAFFYLLALIILLYGARYKRQGFFSDCLGLDQANAIKGFFILMVFLGHCVLTIKNAGHAFLNVSDAWGERIWSEFGQLIVVMFLFYSGYGVMESYREKGRDYLRSFPRRRILTTLLNFDIAVLLFVALDLILGIKLGFKQIGLSLLAWESVGNSNWYIFIILFCYVAAYLGFWLLPNDKAKSSSLVFLMVLLGMVGLAYKKPVWWYNTLLCFPAGMVFSVYKERITGFFQKNYRIVLLAALGLFLLLHFVGLPGFHGITHNVKSVLFAILIILLTMKVKTGNPVLLWLGINVFPIYIYQRIPMIAMTKLFGDGFVSSRPYVFVLICMIATFFIAWGYRYWRVKLS